MDKLRAFLTNEGGQFAELADLPYWWDSIPPDALHPELTRYPVRTILLASYSNWAVTKPWAWEGLRRLLKVLLDRREPIPEILQWWANAYAAGTRKPPGQRRGRPENSERNNRLMHAMRILRNDGHTRDDAIDKIAQALDVSFETVRSVVRKVEHDRPFR